MHFISCNGAKTNPTNIRDRNKKKIIKNYKSTNGKTTTQNYRKQIHNLEEEYNSCPRKVTEIVIFKELLDARLHVFKFSHEARTNILPSTVKGSITSSRPLSINMYQVTPRLSQLPWHFLDDYWILCPSYVSDYGNNEQ